MSKIKLIGRIRCKIYKLNIYRLSELPVALNILKSLVPKRPNEATTTFMANYV